MSYTLNCENLITQILTVLQYPCVLNFSRQKNDTTAIRKRFPVTVATSEYSGHPTYSRIQKACNVVQHAMAPQETVQLIKKS